MISSFNPFSEKITTTKTVVAYPISLTEAKRHLRVEDFFVDDDDLIDDLIMDATSIIEDDIQKDIAHKRCTSKLWNFFGDFIEIPEGNFYELETIVKADSSTLLNSLQTLPYYNYFTIHLSATISVPEFSSVDVTYLTGFPFGETPTTLKRAILMQIGNLYDVERQSYTLNNVKETDAIKRLLAKYKNTNF